MHNADNEAKKKKGRTSRIFIRCSMCPSICIEVCSCPCLFPISMGDKALMESYRICITNTQRNNVHKHLFILKLIGILGVFRNLMEICGTSGAYQS